MRLLSFFGPSMLRCGIALAAASVAITACGPQEPKTDGGPVTMRRLTQQQYRNVISDIFGPDIKLVGRMDSPVRKNGLLEIGATEATFTPGSLEQYDMMSRGIAAQILDEKNRKAFMPCTPKSDKASDPACEKQVLVPVGRLLFRRPMTDAEIDKHVALASASADKLGNFYKGLEFGLVSLLDSPSFLFQKDVAEPDPDNKGQFRLNAYSKAGAAELLPVEHRSRRPAAEGGGKRRTEYRARPGQAGRPHAGLRRASKTASGASSTTSCNSRCSMRWPRIR